jgi:hypothetical protein
MFSIKIFSLILLLGLSFFLSSVANAGLTQVSILISETSNDCGNNKFFDDPNPDSALNGFSNCRISVYDNNEPAYLSDVLIKFGGNNNNFDDSNEISNNYTGQIQRTDFNFTADNLNTSGSWIYNNDQFKYPDIRFWTVKGGNHFILFWQVGLAETPDNCFTGTNNLNSSFACMSIAESVTTGSWVIPLNNGGQTAALSHITFLGGLCSDANANFDKACRTPTTTGVPEPTSIILFALALLCIIVKRKKFAS